MHHVCMHVAVFSIFLQQIQEKPDTTSVPFLLEAGWFWLVSFVCHVVFLVFSLKKTVRQAVRIDGSTS